MSEWKYEWLDGWKKRLMHILAIFWDISYSWCTVSYRIVFGDKCFTFANVNATCSMVDGQVFVICMYVGRYSWTAVCVRVCLRALAYVHMQYVLCRYVCGSVGSFSLVYFIIHTCWSRPGSGLPLHYAICYRRYCEINFGRIINLPGDLILLSAMVFFLHLQALLRTFCMVDCSCVWCAFVARY